MNKKITLFVLTALVLAMLFSACQSGKSSDTGKAESTTERSGDISADDMFGGGTKNTDGSGDSGAEERVTAADSVFFRPNEAGTGDVTPIYYDGKYYLFFLHSTNYKWCYVTTTDFVHFSDITVLRNFGGTGDVLNVDGTWHLFASVTEGSDEVIHHYSGSDITTLRDTYQNIASDGGTFVTTSWRDPRVWYDETIGKYRMIVCTCVNDGDSVSRNGAIATLTSDDLNTWEPEGTYFSTGYYTGACECPDHFQIGDWYYLVYSDCSYGKRTYYVKSQSPNGPWQIPENDTFDSLFFYAAKTVSDGTDRYVIGWAGDRSENTLALDADGKLVSPDFATIQYAGSMIVHKLVQKENGDLTAAPVGALKDYFDTPVKNTFVPLSGSWQTGDASAAVTASNCYSTILMQNLPDRFVLTFRLKTDAKQAGIALDVDSTFAGRGYYFVFDKQYSRLKEVNGLLSDIAGYYFPYDTELERPVSFSAGKVYQVTVIADGQIAVVYVDGECALTVRMTSDEKRALGLFCYAGTAEFSEIVMKKK